MASKVDLYKRCRRDPMWESIHVTKRPLRRLQAETVERVERFLAAHVGGVMTILWPRQTGKNETAAVLQRRHLWRHQNAPNASKWIRTAPTYKPQVVNSKIRLRDALRLRAGNAIGYPTFENARLQKEEGYIWRLGGASVEFLSSGPSANVVGGTASECLDMDEAHKVDKAKFDEDFAPFTASTNAGTLLWGVAANGLDCLEWYRQNNVELGFPERNIRFPCEMWMEELPIYAAHVESRAAALGWDHPIIKTQYRLVKVAAEGAFLSEAQVRSLLTGDHERQRKPRHGKTYHIVVDIAAGNEDFDPEADLEGDEDSKTDSTVIWIYEVSPIACANGLYPIIRLVNLKWITGAPLPVSEKEILDMIDFWKPDKVTIDAIGVGRQIAETAVERFGKGTVNAYTASDTSVSADCFDLQARLNHNSVLMFQDDGSPEWAECERQLGWTRYASNGGKMKLIKPDARKHIDMVKALTYIHQNNPVAGVEEILKVEGEF